MTLEQFIDEFGITTHEMLVIRCDRMGVNAPSEDAFKAVVGTTVVSSPTEGVVVLDALPIFDEATGEQIESDEPAPEVSKPRRRRKTETAVKE